MEHSDGIVGQIKRATVTSVTAIGASLVWMFVFLVVGAAVLAIVEYTQAKAVTALSFWKLLFLGLGAILAELIGLKYVIQNWWKALALPTMSWMVIWAVGFGFSLYNALGSAAEFQAKREGVQKAAHVTEITVADELKAAKVARDRIEARIALISAGYTVNDKHYPVRTAGAAQADIDNAAAHKFWASTDGCKETKGKQTREFCNHVAGWKSEKALAGELVTLKAELTAAKSDVSKYEGMVTGRKVATTSEDTPFVRVVSKMSGYKPEDVAFWEPMQTSISNMLLVSFAGLVLGLVSVQGTPRTRWINWKRISRGLFGGKVEPEATLSQEPAASVPMQAPTIHTIERIREQARPAISWRELSKALNAA